MKITTLAIYLSLVSIAFAGGPSTQWKEVVSPNEAAIFAALPAEFNKMQRAVADDAGAKAERGLHNKPHLTLKGTLKVLDSIPAPYRQGFFATPATYQTWVRFSNGQGVRQEDRKPDLRGFAVKVLGAPGENFGTGGSFDMLFNNFPAQPARDIHQFMSFIRCQKNPLTLPIKLAAAIGFSETARILKWAANNLGTKVPSLATTDFFTGLPLQYGTHACKIRLRANNGNPPGWALKNDPDYLRNDLSHRMNNLGLKYDVEVQLFTDETNTPIEDASVVWNSPYVKVAELTLAPRDVKSPQSLAQEATGNKLLWNPWNAPKEHRPLGQLMRARRTVYPGSGRERGAVAPARP